jgi:hypothetical protein
MDGLEWQGKKEENEPRDLMGLIHGEKEGDE